MSDHDQISLFEQGAVADAPAQTWPDASRFPLNLVGEGTVAGQVEKDLAGCADALVVAGYAGLRRLVSFLGKQSLSADQPFRLLLGAEPYPTARSDFSMRGRDLPDEVREFWLSRGVSLRLSGMLIQVIEDLRRGGRSGPVTCRVIPVFCTRRSIAPMTSPPLVPAIFPTPA